MSVRPFVSSAVILLVLSIVGCSGNATPELGPVVPPEPDGSGTPSDDASDADAGFDGRDTSSRPDGKSADGDAAALSERDATGGGDVSSDRSDVADAGRTALCIRLYDPMKPDYINTLSEQVEGDYFERVYQDCDVAKLARTEPDTFYLFANDLLFYSLDLWGCSKRTLTDFGLGRPEFPNLTSADVARLIDHYIAAATKILRLDATEAAQMRADLTTLGASAITRPSQELALSMCGPDGGGDADAAAQTDAGGAE